MGAAVPVAVRDRIVVLDVLRGLALWGVLIGNTVWLYSARRFVPGHPASELDLPAAWFVALVVDGKAMTLLTFLFGLGFALQLVRGQERGTPVARPFARRLAVLFLLGWAHVAFVWWGDVTWTYALVGFTLLAFAHVRDRWLVVWAAGLTFVPAIVLAIPALAEPVWGVVADRAELQAEYVAAAKHGTFGAVVLAHLQQAVVFSTPGALLYMPWEVGRFLLGLLAGRRHLFDADGAGHLRTWRRVLAIAAVLAAAGAAKTIAERLVLPDYELELAGRLALVVVDELGTLGMAGVYVAATVLLFQRARVRRVLRIVAPAGRMPLTTYVMQSVIMTTVFYGRGFGMLGELSFAACLGLALAVFPVQVAFAHVWLRAFRFGPLEWLWRSLAYGRLQPMSGRSERAT